jgi:thiopeptide-type bacteriocin biosynthesis protein
LLYRKCVEAMVSDAAEVSFRDADLAALENVPSNQLPERYSLQFSVVAAGLSEDANATRFLWKGASFGSSFNLFGRHGNRSNALAALTRSLALEEQHLVDAHGAVLADICYLPTARHGNVMARAAVASHFIPVLVGAGESSATPILLNDLVVSIRRGRVVLRSIALDREVIPRLGNPHHFLDRGAGLYKFLCMLAYQHVPELGFGWPASLAHVIYRKRITYGRLILAPATWFFRTEDLAGIRRSDTLETSLVALAALVRRWNLPGRIAIDEGGQLLDIDLNILASVELLLDAICTQQTLTLRECFDASGSPDDVRSAVFCNEVILPIVRTRLARPAIKAPISVESQQNHVAVRPQPNSELPSGEWMYLKLFCVPDMADDLLAQVIGPMMEKFKTEAVIDRWFFIRYEEPEFHLRLRVFSRDTTLLWGQAFPSLTTALHTAVPAARPWRVQLDSYQPEVIRYGGPVGMEIAERLFYHDSMAFMAVLGLPARTSDHATRWKVAAVSVDAMLSPFALTASQRAAFCQRMAMHRAAELGLESSLNAAVGRIYRDKRVELAASLREGMEGSAERDVQCVYAARSKIDRPLVEAYLHHMTRLLEVDRDETLASLCHMSCNRLFRTQSAKQEMVTMGLLQRHYRKVVETGER